MSIACPKCGKLFSKETSVTCHLSQPRSSCHSSIRDMVDISQFAESVLQSRRPPDPSPPSEANHHDQSSHFDAGGDIHADVDFFEGAGEGFMSAEEWYEGAGACYSQDGLTFLDIFDADKYAGFRKDNLFYPFASKEEWEIADFLLRSPLSMAAISEFLALPMIRKLKLSFSTAKELRSRAEMLPKGPSWKCQMIPSLHRTKNPIQLFWRDPVECLETLFSNPLFHDKLDFVPHRVYKTAAWLTRVYSEWLMGDSAWEFQSQVPRGTTILDTILSSDKTNITTMTGARVAHPLLLGLANIRMQTCTKLSSKAFLLTALLPIPQYLHPTQQMRGVLEDRLIHQCLSIILKPLMIAAEIGIMMSDPVGNLAKICVDPTDLEAYFNACAVYRLNGVFTPFWQNWPLACPSVFLTPEALHHWHKQFFDHDLQWCIEVVGAQELDFRFSILQPITGYRHYSGGITKLKQVTGQSPPAAPRRFVIVIRALMDVRYLAQSPSPDDNLLASVDQSLSTFHQNKDAIMQLGAWIGAKKPINNWFIPKLELMQSITASTRKVGALIQWSADATEHAHVSEIKDPARQTNNNDYDPQICRHLDRQEKLQRFAIAMTLKSRILDPDEGDDEELIEREEEEPSTDPQTALLEELNHTCVTTNYFSKAKKADTASRGPGSHPPQTFIAGNTAIHLNYSPTHTGMQIDDVADEFNIPDLRYAILNFLQHDARSRDAIHGVGISRRSLIDHPSTLPFDRVQVWHTVHLQEVSFHDSSIVLPAQTLHASPPCPGWPKGRQDAILINVDREHEWPQSGLRGSRITWRDQYLCYVHSLKVGAVHPVAGMHVLKRAKHADGAPVGDIVPLKQMRAFVSMIPELGAAADARLTKATSTYYSSSFFLNKYFSKDFYHALYHASQG
ncbi:hypothetical protein DFH29DRAFT_982960 [Suillus ampliporus]|nr:hypothetical protein DFH29DRAFT_982960 [Suillus ampliporus]